jgi:hypothetical protein
MSRVAEVFCGANLRGIQETEDPVVRAEAVEIGGRDFVVFEIRRIFRGELCIQLGVCMAAQATALEKPQPLCAGVAAQEFNRALARDALRQAVGRGPVLNQFDNAFTAVLRVLHRGEIIFRAFAVVIVAQGDDGERRRTAQHQQNEHYIERMPAAQLRRQRHQE